MEFLLDEDKKGLLSDAGLLVTRVSAGLMMLLGYGIGKIENFDGIVQGFDGLLGLPGIVNAVLVVFAEVVCAVLLACGAVTRFAAGLLSATMAVAAYEHLINRGDPVFATSAENGSAEPAVIFGIVFLVFIFTGPGKFSVDRLLEKRWKSK